MVLCLSEGVFLIIFPPLWQRGDRGDFKKSHTTSYSLHHSAQILKDTLSENLRALIPISLRASSLTLSFV